MTTGHSRQHNPQIRAIWVTVATALCVLYPESFTSLPILEREWTAHRAHTYHKLHDVSQFMEADHWSVGSSKTSIIYWLFVFYVLVLPANTALKSSKFLDCNLNLSLDNLQDMMFTETLYSTSKIKDDTRRIC